MEGTSMVGIQPTMPIGGDGFGFGGGSAWIMLIFAFLILGGGFGGYGVNRQNVATTEELSAGFNFAGVNNSLKDLMLGQANINQNLGNAVCQSTYELASKIDNCCCQTQLGIKDLMATVVAEGSATRNLIQENKIDSLQAQVNQLQLAQATCGLPRVSTTAWGVYPLTCQYGCGYTNGYTNV